MTMIAEGAEAKRQEDALAERKRKAEEKERWEGASRPPPFRSLLPHSLFPPRRRAGGATFDPLARPLSKLYRPRTRAGQEQGQDKDKAGPDPVLTLPTLSHGDPPAAETREDRVHDWRNFNKKKKKTRKGPEVLG